jgi:hypothetical protein
MLDTGGEESLRLGLSAAKHTRVSSGQGLCQGGLTFITLTHAPSIVISPFLTGNISARRVSLSSYSQH